MNLASYSNNNLLIVFLSYLTGLAIYFLPTFIIILVIKPFKIKTKLFKKPLILLTLITCISEMWILALITFFSYQIQHSPISSNLLTSLNLILNGVIVYGLWKNKRWAIIGMFTLAIIVNLESILMKNWSFVPLMTFVLPLLLLFFLSKME